MKSICTEAKCYINKEQSVEIYFVNPDNKSSDDNDYIVAKLNIDDAVINAAKSVVADFFDNIKDRQKIPVENLESEDEQYVLTMPADEVDSLSNVIQLIKEEKYKTFDPHNCSEFLNRLKYYIIYITINGKGCFLMRRYTKSRLITPKKLYLFFKEDSFTHLENGNIFALDNSIDAFVLNGTIYIVNEKQFSLATGYYKKERMKAKETLNEIEKIGIISDFQSLKEHCMDRISYIKKLSKVNEETLRLINFNNIIALKEKRGADFIVDKKSHRISFENVQQLRNIIDLVLDNYVLSEVTNTPYISVNKRHYRKA
ncbi:MAG: DUF4868 domain-containing protein [Clostridiales bacterium]|nr:DUF4868 domain-containing protein [Clostridiales bacterium]